MTKETKQKNTKTGPASSGPIPGKTFKVKVGQTYWKQGFFNVGVDWERYFGGDREGITIALGNGGHTIGGHINRSVNSNNTPRIMGGKELRDWFHINCKVGDLISVDILSRLSIRVRRK